MNRRRIICLALIGFTGVLSAAYAQNAAHTNPPPIHYKVAVNPLQRAFNVTVHVEGWNVPHLDFAMPRWTPGVYSFENFGRHVRNVMATATDGKPLVVTQRDANTWRVDTKGVNALTLTYDALEAADIFWAEVQGSSLGYRSPFINGTVVFGYIVGQTQRPVTVEFQLPIGWKIATPLEPMTPFSLKGFTAPNYDVLIDSPFVLGQFQRVDREVNGTRLSLVASGETLTQVEWAKLINLTERIVKTQTDIMQDTPPRYLFIFRFLKGDDENVLQHAHCGVIVLPKSRLLNSLFGAFTLAHVFFHSWNGKRIHPAYFDNLNYTRLPDRPLLWFHEGITHYYAYLTLLRAGIWTPEQFYTHLISTSQTDHPYYQRSALLGLVFAIRLRDVTHNQKGLDDLMRLLNDRYGKTGKGYTGSDLVNALNELAGGRKVFNGLYEQLVVKEADVPLEEFLAVAGLRLEEKTEMLSGFSAEVATDPTSGRPQITSVVLDSSEAKSGLQVGDMMLSVDDVIVGKDLKRTQELLQRKKVGDEFVMRVWRPSEQRVVYVKGTLEEKEVTTTQIVELPDAKGLPKLIRTGILQASYEQPSIIARSGLVGLRAVYFQDTDKGKVQNNQFNKPIGWKTFEKQVVEREEKQIIINYPGNAVPHQGMRPTYWSAKFTGTLYVRHEGDYMFYFDNLKDGARLRIDGMSVLDSWLVRQNPVNVSSSYVPLKEGAHKIELEYAHGMGNASLTLAWSSSLLGKQAILPGALPTKQTVAEIYRKSSAGHK